MISASRRTDLVAFFPEWLAGALRRRRVCFAGPRGRVHDVDLSPEAVHTVGLWSKDLSNLLRNAYGLRGLSNRSQVRQNTLEEARIQARVAYEKDIIYRHWNTMHGGVYVAVTPENQPNPFLEDNLERDVTTTTGKRLTLMNPSYMTRQANEVARETVGVRGHITSLNPIRPANAPDTWEREALQSFDRGAREAHAVELLDGVEFMRFMQPMLTEPACLQCHAKQDYRAGQIRGGISVAVPLEPLRVIERRDIEGHAGSRHRQRSFPLGHPRIGGTFREAPFPCAA